MNNNQKVSVVIPVFNGEKYIGEAIESVLRQTHKNLEVIIVDDGSTDKTRQIIRRAQDSRITYFFQENKGVSVALNRGISAASGDYFSWLSHDDVYREDKIEIQLKASEAYGRNAIIHSDYETYNQDTGERKTIEIKSNNKINIDYNPLYLIIQSKVNGCCLFFPKEIYKDKGFKFKEHLLNTQDYDLWVQIFPNRKIVNINKALVTTRIHVEQNSIRHPMSYQENIDLWKQLCSSIFYDENKWGPVSITKILTAVTGHLMQSNLVESKDFAWGLLVNRVLQEYKFEEFRIVSKKKFSKKLSSKITVVKGGKDNEDGDDEFRYERNNLSRILSELSNNFDNKKILLAEETIFSCMLLLNVRSALVTGCVKCINNNKFYITLNEIGDPHLLLDPIIKIVHHDFNKQLEFKESNFGIDFRNDFFVFNCSCDVELKFVGKNNLINRTYFLQNNLFSEYRINEILNIDIKWLVKYRRYISKSILLRIIVYKIISRFND
jgi:glycosyltransferase involved in cell wall biosynthesis